VRQKRRQAKRQPQTRPKRFVTVGHQKIRSQQRQVRWRKNQNPVKSEKIESTLIAQFEGAR
jgi:hypothetical protein